MYGCSTKVGGIPIIDKLASDVASPATFLTASFMLPVRRRMSPTRVNVNKSSSTMSSIVTFLLRFSATPFKNLYQTKSHVLISNNLYLKLHQL